MNKSFRVHGKRQRVCSMCDAVMLVLRSNSITSSQPCCIMRCTIKHFTMCNASKFLAYVSASHAVVSCITQGSPLPVRELRNPARQHEMKSQFPDLLNRLVFSREWKPFFFFSRPPQRSRGYIRMLNFVKVRMYVRTNVSMYVRLSVSNGGIPDLEAT